jgi:hypothetical protein
MSWWSPVNPVGGWADHWRLRPRRAPPGKPVSAKKGAERGEIGLERGEIGLDRKMHKATFFLIFTFPDFFFLHLTLAP